MQEEIAANKFKTHRQPQPFLHQRGDCGACVVAGITGLTPNEIYEYHGKIDGMAYSCMVELLKKLKDKNVIEDFRAEMPLLSEFLNEPEFNTFGRPGWMNAQAWFAWAVNKFYNGYIGIAAVSMTKNGHVDASADHWVMLNGRDWDSGSVRENKIHVSCSWRGEYKQSVHEFLKTEGGYNTIWVKPFIP